MEEESGDGGDNRKKKGKTRPRKRSTTRKKGACVPVGEVVLANGVSRHQEGEEGEGEGNWSDLDGEIDEYILNEEEVRYLSGPKPQCHTIIPSSPPVHTRVQRSYIL